MIIFPDKKQKSNSYINEYFLVLNQILKKIDTQELKKIAQTIEKSIKSNKKIFSAGNGGSGSLANHLMCDYLKGIRFNSNNKFLPKVISLSNSTELITAIGNDSNFEDIFSFQFESLAQKDDCVIVFSCSGTSKNIKKLVKSAIKKKAKLILFTGFFRKKINYNIKNFHHINLNCKNYGICEDVFSSIMHSIMQLIVFKNIKNKKFIF